MPLGIRLTVDFAFKKTFGTPENAPALIGLLNAILDLEVPIQEVTILNPFNYQEFADDKLIVLDVRCCDAAGRLFNVEMQMSTRQHLPNRLLYYACSMYVGQLRAGQSYSDLRSAVTICLRDQVLFRETSHAHHRFQLADEANGRKLPNGIEVHIVELTKYDIGEQTIGTKNPLHQWVFLLLRSQDYDEMELKRLLPGSEFQLAITTLATIAAKTEDLRMYDQREKARRDYEWGVSGAYEDGREDGREEGFEAGLQRGEIAGTIRTLQQLLGDAVSSPLELREKSLEALQAQAAELQERIAGRSSSPGSL